MTKKDKGTSAHDSNFHSWLGPRGNGIRRQRHTEISRQPILEVKAYQARTGQSDHGSGVRFSRGRKNEPGFQSGPGDSVNAD